MQRLKAEKAQAVEDEEYEEAAALKRRIKARAAGVPGFGVQYALHPLTEANKLHTLQLGYINFNLPRGVWVSNWAWVKKQSPGYGPQVLVHVSISTATHFGVILFLTANCLRLTPPNRSFSKIWLLYNWGIQQFQFTQGLGMILEGSYPLPDPPKPGTHFLVGFFLEDLASRVNTSC